MFQLKIVEKVFYKKRTGFSMFYKHRKIVLFFFFFIPLILSTISSASFAETNQVILYVPQESIIHISIPLESGNFNMTMETYLIWMLFITMPSDYEEEAMKAQAILLRTELIRSHIKEENIIYLKKNTMLQEYFSYFFESINKEIEKEHFQKCQQAVIATKGIYLTFQSEPAIAPWFRVSAGATRTGSEVLPNKEYEWLLSTSCDRDYQAADFLTKIEIKKADYFTKLIEWMSNDPDNQEMKKTKPSQIILEQEERDSAGYLLNLRYQITWEDGTNIIKKIPGEAFREIFQLPSSHIEITDMGSNVMFIVKGQGHGFGMSQFTANQLAKQGMDYVGILNTFFTNIAIDKFE